MGMVGTWDLIHNSPLLQHWQRCSLLSITRCSWLLRAPAHTGFEER